MKKNETLGEFKTQRFKSFLYQNGGFESNRSFEKYLLRWPVTGVFIVNETLNETRRNTQKLFSHHEETVLQKLF